MTSALFDGVADAVYVISLPGSERRSHIDEHFAEMGCAFEYFDAYSGTDMDQTALAETRTVDANHYEKRHHLPGEVGCYFSHVGLMVHALGRGHRRIAVFEDDAQFTADQGAVRTALDSAPADFDMLHLSSHLPVGMKPAKDVYRTPVNSFWRKAFIEGGGTAGYVAGSRTLSYLVRNAFPMTASSDGLVNWASAPWCDVDLKCFLADPLLVSCREYESQIRSALSPREDPRLQLTAKELRRIERDPDARRRRTGTKMQVRRVQRQVRRVEQKIRSMI